MDTTILIAAEQKGDAIEDILYRVRRAHGEMDTALSAISVVELTHGLYRAKTDTDRGRRRIFAEGVFNHLVVHPITFETTLLVGHIEGEQAAVGNVIAFEDLLIGATALHLKFDLATLNIKHFQRSLASRSSHSDPALANKPSLQSTRSRQSGSRPSQSAIEPFTRTPYARMRVRTMEHVPHQGWEAERSARGEKRALAHDTVALFGLPITNVNMDQAIQRINGYILSGQVHQIATANLDFARNCLLDSYLHGIICDCSMVLPDGAPMVWASKMLGAPLEERVTGVDLVPELARLAADRGYRVYFLGSSEHSSSTAANTLLKRFPKLQIVGRSCPPIASLNDMDNETMLADIQSARPNIIFIGFGNPKQEIWIHRHKDRLPPSVVIGIGGALDMIAGKLRRAPRWIQFLQMEWIFRMAQEPARLLPRYLGDAKALLRHLPRGLMASRMQPFERRQRGSAVQVIMGARVFATPGKIGDRASALLLQEAKLAAANGETLVVNMAATLRIEAEGIGGLLDARRVLLDAGQSMWLAAISTPVIKVLWFSAVADLFHIAPTPTAAIEASQSSRPKNPNALSVETPPTQTSGLSVFPTRPSTR